MFKNRNYSNALSILRLHENQRKKKYYKKYGMKIVGRFCYQNLIPKIKLNWGLAPNTFRVVFGTNSNSHLLHRRYVPDVEILFDIFNYHCIYLTIIKTGIVVDEIENASSLVSLVPILKKCLEPVVERFNAPRNFSEMDIREPCSEMTIQNRTWELIDYMPLYEITSEEIIRMIFIAIDSEYLNIPVDYHVCYD